MSHWKLKTLLVGILFICFSCTNQQNVKVETSEAKGKLFIIGGGARPVEMLQSLIHLSGVDTSGYIIVLPMASGMIDTATFYSKKQFLELGCSHVFAINFQSVIDMTKSRIDSVRNASLIYISGGDQNKFMHIVKNTELFTSIHEAYQNGATIAGTSAGAAVMSKKMITGNELKHPEYTGNYRSIEANNIEIGEGLALIKGAIVDQHFVKRMRMNRLISVCLENPEETSIGIDESTALFIDGDLATVYGLGQVIVLKNKVSKSKSTNGLLGGIGIELSVYLAGDTFNYKH